MAEALKTTRTFRKEEGVVYSHLRRANRPQDLPLGWLYTYHVSHFKSVFTIEHKTLTVNLSFLFRFCVLLMLRKLTFCMNAKPGAKCYEM